eukprot:scaffold28544_cov78-Attheya_sp.AAC.2
MFPTPTQSQMLRTYNESVIRKFGKAHIFMLMDATEITAKKASMKLVNSALYSAYKHNSIALKWLTGMDTIGTSWHNLIPRGGWYPGSVSDIVMMSVTKSLEQIHSSWVEWMWKLTRVLDSQVVCIDSS